MSLDVSAELLIGAGAKVGSGATCHPFDPSAGLRDGGYLDVRIDHALAERAPPRPDLQLTHGKLERA